MSSLEVGAWCNIYNNSKPFSCSRKNFSEKLLLGFKLKKSNLTQVRLENLFYKCFNHEESFRAVKINHKNLVK